MPRSVINNVLTVAAVACTLVGGAAATFATRPPPSASAERTEVNQLESVMQLAALLDCRREIVLADDLYNFAPMSGLYCETASARVVTIRSYPTRRDADIALQDWPLAATDQHLVRGDTWFAVGALDDIGALSEHGGAGTPTQNPPQVVALSQAEQGRSTCVRVLTNALRDRAVNRAQFETERADFDALFPGLVDLIEHEVHPDTVRALQDAAEDDLQFESILSRMISPLKAYCADAVLQ